MNNKMRIAFTLLNLLFMFGGGAAYDHRGIVRFG